MKFSKQSKSFSLVKVLHGDDNAIEGKVRISKNYFKINILINGRLTYLRKPLAYFQQKLEINELTVQIVINEYNSIQMLEWRMEFHHRTYHSWLYKFKSFERQSDSLSVAQSSCSPSNFSNFYRELKTHFQS